MKSVKSELTIDAVGRIVLPQALRRQFRLAGGSVVTVEVQPEAILLRPRVRHATLTQEHGLLVHEGTAEGDLLTAVEDARRERDRQVHGGI